MKRLLLTFISIMALMAGLALMVQPAQAVLVNEVFNGEFNQADDGWINPVPGHGAFDIWIFFGGDVFYAGLTAPGDEGGISQITDDKAGGGWDPAGTAKKWWFSFDATVPDGFGFGEAYLFYYGVAGAPTALGNPDSPGLGWVEVIDGETTGLVAASGHYSFSGTIPNYQPEWFAVAFEGQLFPDSSGGLGFTNVVLKGECVPVPPSVWLFGSGLLGLAGWRRFRKS